MIDTSAPVVVIYRGGYGAVSIARTLGRLGVPAYLVAQRDMPTPVWSSRYWVRRTRWDFSRPEEESATFLLELGASIQADHGTRAVLLTLADWIAVFIERHRSRLQAQYIFPQPEQPIVHTLLNKWGMHTLANEHGIPTPVTVCPSSLDEVNGFVEGTGFPVVMKAADSFVSDPPPTRLLRSRTELMDLVGPRAAAGAPLNMILQEHIPGDVDTLWMCNGYFGTNRDHDVTFPGRKLRQISAAGVASLAICLPNDTVEAQTRQFMHEIGYRGCVGIGWRYDRRDERYKVLDVNARVSGVFRLFAGTNEMDVVRVCYLDLTGQPVPATSLQPGRKWMLEDDIGGALREMRSGRLSVAGYVRSVRGVQEWHWLATDDPVPFLVWLGGRIQRVGDEAIKRLSTPRPRRLSHP